MLWFIGILAILAFIASTLQSMPYRGGVVTNGTVVSSETRRSPIGDGDAFRRRMRTYAPVVEFSDGDGVKRTVTSRLSGGEQPAVGATLRVSYLPSSPQRARILGDAHTRVGRYLFLIVGGGFLAAAMFIH